MERIVLFMVIVLVVTAVTSEQDVYLEKVGDLVIRVFGQHISGCRAVLLTTHPHSSIVSAILRYAMISYSSVK